RVGRVASAVGHRTALRAARRKKRKILDSPRTRFSDLYVADARAGPAEGAARALNDCLKIAGRSRFLQERPRRKGILCRRGPRPPTRSCANRSFGALTPFRVRLGDPERSARGW